MPPRKRKKSDVEDSFNQTSQTNSRFQEGSILKIKLTNFMTYDKVELRSGGNLNMVLGPNGSGKSAIVCGLIIGLAGDPKTTGRSGSLGEFVKHGCDFAQIEIGLKSSNSTDDTDANNHVIVRKLVVTGAKRDCKTEWLLNKRQVNKEEVKQFINKMNIRVDNLCQFLPQERVVEFVKMNNLELLQNTQKAVGDQNMIKDHEAIREYNNKIEKDEKERISLQAKTDNEVQVNQQLEVEVEKIREKKRIDDQLNYLELKKPWIIFEDKKKEYYEAKKIFDDVKSKLDKEEKKIAPSKKKLDDIKIKVKQVEQVCNELTKDFKDWSKESEVKNREVAELLADNKNRFRDFTTKRNEESQRMSKIQEIRNEIEELQVAISEFAPNDELDKRKVAIEKKGETLRSEITNLKSRRDRDEDKKERILNEITKCQKMIDNNDVQKQRMSLLERKDFNAYKAAKWLSKPENAAKFEATIHMPIMTLLDVEDPLFVKQVENALPRRDLFAFVCESERDLKLFSDELRNINCKVALVMASNESLSNFRSNYSKQEISSLGFKSNVIDMIKGPEPVLAYLCNQYKLHNVLIGDSNVTRNLKDIQHKLSQRNYFGAFFSDKMKYDMRSSRYDNQAIVSSNYLRPPELLVIQGRRDLVERQKEEIVSLRRNLLQVEDEMKTLDSEYQIKVDEKSRLANKFNEIKQEKDRRMIIEGKIERKNREIERRERDRFNEAEEIASLKKFVTGNTAKMMKALNRAKETNRMLEETLMKKMEAQLDRQRLVGVQGSMEDFLESSKAKIEELKRDVAYHEEQRTSAKREAQLTRRSAEETVRHGGYQLVGPERDLPADLKKIFEGLPDTIIEVDSKIKTLMIKRHNMVGVYAESTVDDFQQRQREINDYQKRLKELEDRVELNRRSRDVIKTKWLATVQAMIDSINENFSQFMARMGYAGGVELSGGKGEFEEYGIGVKVKYRDGQELQELTTFFQSGGERSVATVIYMLALQQLTKVPFRCVDEINQGMDAQNERKVFDLIVDTSTRNSSQYFLFSPKLLLGLNYADNMAIHTITNGPHLAQDWNKYL